MTWLIEDQEINPSLSLKRLMKDNDIIPVAGVYNPICALLARRAGFQCCYLSGGALSASLGLPDLSLIELSEVSMMTRYIYRASNLPLIVDVDVGFGEALNVSRTAKEIEEARGAAIQIEDQVLPKKCGHLADKKIVDAEIMIEKIAIARKSSKSLIIIARTDAKAIYGIEEAIRRAKLYLKAGVDVIFPEALETEDEFKLFAKEISAPLLANMTEFGRTPYISIQKFKELGYKFVIFPVTALRLSNKTVLEGFKNILTSGTQKEIISKMQTRQELYDLIKYKEYENLNKEV
jgi:methylisocitrate lyase